jgi:hypothetical protein
MNPLSRKTQLASSSFALSRHAAAILCGLVMCGYLTPVQAQAPVATTPAAAAPVMASNATSNAKDAALRSVPLSNLSSRVGPIRLTRMDGSASLSIPAARRENIKSAVLHLVTTNSISLKERSQLVVRLNNRTVAQLQLSARQPEITADIRLPAELLQPGYNQLSFKVAQHSQDVECEDPNAPELWTEIDTTASVLRLQTELKPLTPQLSDLNDLFDPKQQTLQKINIVTAGHPDSDAILSAGGMLAQGIGVKFRYLMPEIRQLDAQAAAGGNGSGNAAPGLASTTLAGADNLLVGTAAALKPYLDSKIIEQIKGSFLAVYPMPDGQHFLMVVAGRDDKEVQRAAETFAWQRLDLPAQSQWNISNFTPPKMPDYLPQANIAAQGLYNFKQLGFNTAAFSGNTSAEVNINLPPDVYAQEDAQMEFRLNFSQPAKVNSEITVNLFLNDVFQRSITIDERQGGYYENYRLSLPLRNFRPGTNVLSFRPAVIPQNACAQTGPSPMALFDDSSVKVPYMYRFAQLPDLARFSSNAFPYVSQSDGRQLSLQVADKDSATIGAAWTLLGKLAQKQTVPLSAAQITFGAPAAQRNVLIVGNVATLPHDVLGDAPWKLDGSLTFTGASIPMASPSPESGWFQQQFKTLAGTNRSNAQADYLNTSITGDARLTRQFLVMQFRAQKLGDATTTVFASASPAQLQEGMRQLVAPAYWNNLAGDVSLLTLGKPDVATQRIGATYNEGKIGKTEYIGYIGSKYPWTMYGVTVLALAVLALLCLRLLRSFLRRRRNVDGV